MSIQAEVCAAAALRVRKSILIICIAAVCFTGRALRAQFPAAAPVDPAEAQIADGAGRVAAGSVAQAVPQRGPLPHSGARQSAGPAYQKAAFTRKDAIPLARWTSLGPTSINSLAGGILSGRIPSIAMDPANPSVLYVAAAGGGVWKSSDRGASWSPMTDNLPSLSSGAVAVDPFTGQIWYGTGELNFCRDCYYGAGVYSSSDGGASWTRVAAENFLSSATSLIAFDPRNRGTMFIGRSTALWKSADGGATWRAVLRGVITDLVINPVDSAIIYAAAGNYSGAPENGVYASKDGGETWTALSGGLPPQASLGRIALAVAPSSPSTVYALIASAADNKLAGLFRSLDGGATWTAIGAAPRDLFTDTDGSGNGFYDICMRVDSNDASSLYLGGIDLWKSADGGATWRDLSIGSGLHEDQHQIVFDASVPQTLYVASDGGIWRSSDGGSTFASLNATLGISQIQAVGLHPSDPNQAFGATEENGLVQYRGGFAWDQVLTGDAGRTFYEDSNPQTIYLAGRDFALRRSDDLGTTFTGISAGIDIRDRVQFQPPFLNVPGHPGWLIFGTQRVWFSFDEGNHWTAVSGDLTGGGTESLTTLTVAPSDSNFIYAGSSDGHFAVSTDAGGNWSQGAPIPGGAVTAIAVDPGIAATAYIALSGFGTGHVFRTPDRGGTIADISANLPNVPVNALLADAAVPGRLFAGTDSGVFVLGTDGSWSPIVDGMPNAVVLALAQNASTGMLIAATHGRGIFALDLATATPRVSRLLNSAGMTPSGAAPGMLVTLTGLRLATDAESHLTASLPDSLGGTTVLVNGDVVPLIAVSPTQIDFIVPYASTGSTADVSVIAAGGRAGIRVPMLGASPAIFEDGTDADLFHANGMRVTDAAPATAGEEVVFYAAGMGAVDQSVIASAPSPASPLANTATQPLVSVGGIPATVNFSGLSPGLIGIYQVNFVAPSGIAGDLPLVVQIAGATSNTVAISVAP